MCLVPQLCLTVCDSMDCSPPGSSVHGDSADKNTGVGCLAPCPGDLPNPGIGPSSPQLRQILYHLSHQGSPGLKGCKSSVNVPFRSQMLKGSQGPHQKTARQENIRTAGASVPLLCLQRRANLLPFLSRVLWVRVNEFFPLDKMSHPLPWETVASPSPVWFSNWTIYQNRLEGSLDHRMAGSQPQFLVRQVWVQCDYRICSTHKVLGVADAAGLATPALLLRITT